MIVLEIIIALSAVAATVAAWRAAIETRKTSFAQILLQITDNYGSPEMLEGILLLQDWQKRYSTDFANKFGELRRNEYHKIIEQDKARRRYSHHFHALLLATELVNEDFVKKVVKPNQVDFLLDVVEPLEEAIDVNYDHSTFDTFRRLFRADSGTTA